MDKYPSFSTQRWEPLGHTWVYTSNFPTWVEPVVPTVAQVDNLLIHALLNGFLPSLPRFPSLLPVLPGITSKINHVPQIFVSGLLLEKPT